MNAMAITAIIVVVLIVGSAITRRKRANREVRRNSIEPDALFAALKARDVLLYDVRQPLDFLAYPEIIPGAIRIAPKDIAEQTAWFARDQNSVIYCTGEKDETSRMIMGKARALHFTRVKMLKGGLAAWKAKGYPVEPFEESFHLDNHV